jgi:hypothetical protein
MRLRVLAVNVLHASGCKPAIIPISVSLGLMAKVPMNWARPALIPKSRRRQVRANKTLAPPHLEASPFEPAPKFGLTQSDPWGILPSRGPVDRGKKSY